jgi:pyridoxine 5-phosphate synthase
MTKSLNQTGVDFSSDKMRLGVNVDHVATVRNARGGSHPDPVRAAEVVMGAGVDIITVHLREDRRHILDEDLFRLIHESELPVNLEMAATDEMLSIAIANLPKAVCLVPEKREELTTEGGLDVAGKMAYLKEFIGKISESGIKVATFIDPDEKQIEASYGAGAGAVELHVGRYCHLFDTGADSGGELKRLRQASRDAVRIGLECHAGHGLNYESVPAVAQILEITELNIGHFMIGESIFTGLENVVSRMRQTIDVARSSECVNL